MHHLSALRLAGPVRLTTSMGEGKGIKHYTARPESVAAAFEALQPFLGQDA